MSGHSRTFADIVRCPLPDRHGHHPIGVSACPAVSGSDRSTEEKI
jgi:hypothetical protein